MESPVYVKRQKSNATFQVKYSQGKAPASSKNIFKQKRIIGCQRDTSFFFPQHI
jgi:hypothetical protein